MTTAAAHHLESGNDDWIPFVLGQVKWLRQGPDIHTGIWRCTKAEQSSEYLLDPEISADEHANETLWILNGIFRMKMTNGSSIDMGPGDCGSFVRSAIKGWEILEDVEYFFVLS